MEPSVTGVCMLRGLESFELLHNDLLYFHHKVTEETIGTKYGVKVISVNLHLAKETRRTLSKCFECGCKIRDIIKLYRSCVISSKIFK
jgi:hypothetical protein